MIYEFTAGNQHWYIHTDAQYIKIVDLTTQTTLKESNQLSLLGELDNHRITAYANTYEMIAISPPLDPTKTQHTPTLTNTTQIIWQHTPKHT